MLSHIFLVMRTGDANLHPGRLDREAEVGAAGSSGQLEGKACSPRSLSRPDVRSVETVDEKIQVGRLGPKAVRPGGQQVTTYAERYAAGRALRRTCSRKTHAAWRTPLDGRDPVQLVLGAEKGCLSDLLPRPLWDVPTISPPPCIGCCRFLD